MKKGFLIDMDGVIYRSAQLIPGAVRFIQMLQEWGIPFLFLTNNSQRTRRDVATKIQRMGFDVEEQHIFTCAMATARFLARQKPGGTAYVIGEGGLLNALHQNGYSVVDKSRRLRRRRAGSLDRTRTGGPRAAPSRRYNECRRSSPLIFILASRAKP